MKRIPNLHYAIILVIILVGLFTYTIIHNYSGITGSFTGDLKVHIRSPNEYFNENIVIANGTSIDTGINVSLLFNTNDTLHGFINVTAYQNNPTSNAFTEKASLNRFLIISGNLTFQNASITFKYNYSELGNLDESSLRVYRFSNVTGNWDVLPGSVDTDSNEVFGVTTGFSTFGVFGDSAQQQSVPGTGTGGGGGGGGGSAAEIKEDFTVAPKIITTTLLQEQGKSLDLQIKNTGNKEIDIRIEMQNLSEFAIISESDFVLDVDETKVIRLDLFALGEQKPGIYIGKIVIKGISTPEIINVVIDVKDVFPEYKKAVAEGKLVVLVQLENISLRRKLVDVELFLFIMDFDKKILYESSKETLAAGTQLSAIREFNIPSYTPVGKYLVIAEMRYDDNITVNAYDTFDVVEKKEAEKEADIEKPAPYLGITSPNALPNFWIIAILIAITKLAVAVFLLYKKIKSLQTTSPKIKSKRH
ncbi:hypothetical protein HY772_06470 [Candidatus Woesearchaeota archaeon]|nr:hypothetical protein [Candidatus Woesearchaeota archaeon]